MTLLERNLIANTVERMFNTGKYPSSVKLSNSYQKDYPQTDYVYFDMTYSERQQDDELLALCQTFY